MILLKNLLKISDLSNLIKENDKILVAFSGGPDSVFLTELLKEFQKITPFTFSLAHVNHMLRGEAANADEEFAKKYGKDNNINVYTIKIDVKKIAHMKKITIEEAGRNERYKFFNTILKNNNYNKIALAHNKDDQIETFLFRMIRGTSLDGLNGILSREDYIRPISNVYKKNILDYLNNFNIKYCVDDSNFHSDYTRNSIRLELIPFIEKKYNNQFKEKVFSLIEEIRVVNNQTQVKLDSYLDEYKKKLILKKILDEPEFIQKKIIRDYIYSQVKKISLNRKKLDNIQEILLKNGTKKIDLNKEYIIIKNYNYLSIENKSLLLSKEKQKEGINDIDIDVKVNRKILIGDYEINADSYDDNHVNHNEKNVFYTNIRIDELLHVRYKREGDKIVPIGMSSAKKLKEIFINEKIPRDERGLIPLITYKDEIVWVVGVKKSQIFKYSSGNEEKQSKSKNIKLTVRRI
ncbi:tRNA lysidine(34) synthetase TilS [Fusobacterium sp. PH5-44]|uniref:tRNA lysidine(34) synthetase TilS n=1 Tax=unclassified Fusobacterium TaxID=2648384 RepID=UPI003D1A20A3